MTREIWRPIPGFPGYEVSDLGRVKSLKRKSPRILRPATYRNRHGVMLRTNGESKFILVSHLVSSAFIGPCPDGMQVCHNDSDSLNDKANNLRYDTQLGNLKDASLLDAWHGTNAKFTNAIAKEMRDNFSNHSQIKTWAKKYCVSESAIYCILTGRTFKYAGGMIRKNLWTLHRKDAKTIITPTQNVVYKYRAGMSYRTFSAKLSEIVPVSYQAVANWETGESVPLTEMLLILYIRATDWRKQFASDCLAARISDWIPEGPIGQDILQERKAER